MTVDLRNTSAGLLATLLACGGFACAKEAGVFYSTLYAYDPDYRMTRVEGFGVGAAQKLFGDVNGDGRDDAVATFYSVSDGLRVEVALSDGSDFVNPGTWLTWPGADGTEKVMLGDVTGDGNEDLVAFRDSGGVWEVAVSDGSGFAAPVSWSTGNGIGSDFQFLADVDADGKADAMVSWQNFNNGDWRAAASSGSGFGAFSILKQGFGTGQRHFVGDLDADNKADFISYEAATGDWDICINGGATTLDIETDFGTDAEFVTVHDVDNNGSADLVYVDGLESRVRYLNNDLSLVEPRHRWMVQGRSRWRELYADAQTDIASMDGSGHGQMFCSYNGTWQALPPNANKGATLFGERVNTWEVWTNHYLPVNPATGEYGYYDSGDPAVNDAQIRQMHDFGFDYVMFDITNGVNQWVDSRAKAFISRIRLWNESLQPGQHKMHFCIALGQTRGVTGGETAFFTKLEEECQRAWDEFYEDNLDLVYHLDGEPLLIHMLDGNAEPFWGNLDTWAGPRVNIDRMTNRNFRNWQRTTGNAPYGWVIPDDTTDHDPNLMTVQPGFANGSTHYSHADGDRFKNHWLRVLKADPESVFVVSWNEDWEQNAIQPAHMNRSTLEAEWTGGKGYPGLVAYTDELGNRMDDYYFVMTNQYLKIYLDGDIYQGTHIKEESSSGIYRADADSFSLVGATPALTPVLVVPDGFRNDFTGAFVQQAATSVIAEWTFDDQTNVSTALGASGALQGVAASPLAVNPSHDSAGVGAVPNSDNDGFGFGGNSGESVMFIHRANYFPPGTTWGQPADAGDTTVANAPLSFTISADAQSTLTIDSVTIHKVSGSAVIGNFQADGGLPAPVGVTLTPGNQTATIPLALGSPSIIHPGESRTFTLNLNSGALDTMHNINRISLNGSLVQAPASSPVGGWTFNNRSTLATALESSGTATGVTVSPLNVNASHDFAGLSAVPDGDNDGYGFGGNAGESVMFIHRANYFNGQGLGTTTWGAPGGSTGIDTTVANSPLSFTVTTDANTTLTLTSLTVARTPSTATLYQFQSDGFTPGLSPPGSDDPATILLNAPAVIQPGESRTFTLNLNSGALNTAHNLNEITLNGSVVSTATPYELWAAGYPALDLSDLNGDLEPDGIPNVMEFALGGHPNVDDAAWVLPSYGLAGNQFDYTFRRADVAVGSAHEPYAVYSTNLEDWFPAVDGTDGISISVVDDGADTGVDEVTIEVDLDLAPEDQMFLRVAVPQ